jgi:hypothetical protein
MEPESSAIEELQRLRDQVRSSVERVKGMPFNPEDRSEVRQRKKLLKEIARDLRTLRVSRAT